MIHVIVLDSIILLFKVVLLLALKLKLRAAAEKRLESIILTRRFSPLKTF